MFLQIKDFQANYILDKAFILGIKHVSDFMHINFIVIIKK